MAGNAAEDAAMAEVFRIDPNSAAGYLCCGDALFRKQRKKGWAYVPSPDPMLEWAVADTHAHLAMLSDPALSLARCAVLGVDFVCTVVDPTEGEDGTYGMVSEWRSEALRRLPEVYAATRRELARLRQGSDPALGQGMGPDDLLANRCLCAEVSIPRVRVAAGVHPHNAKEWCDSMEARLRGLLGDPLTSALGEIGLDYHYDLSPRTVQQDVFAKQLEIAHETGLPVALHVREAHDDAFAILEEGGWPQAGVILHCCSVGPEELGRWVERGCYVAFGGAVTFAKSDDLRESAKIVPDGRLLTETDSPYMAPVPFRGIECGPEFVVHTAEAIAKVRGAREGSERAYLLRRAHEAGVALLDRKPTVWQGSAANVQRG